MTAVGIDSCEKLRETGAREADLKLKMAYSKVCLIHLYTLEGAIEEWPYQGEKVGAEIVQRPFRGEAGRRII